jgi:hypothetical protein
MSRKHKSKKIQKNLSCNTYSEPVPNINDVLEPLMDILVEMIISKVHGEKEELSINVSDLELMIQNSIIEEDVPINVSDLEATIHIVKKKENITSEEVAINASDLEATVVKEDPISNIQTIINTEDDFTVYPYPMTIEFIRKIMKKDYPKMPEYKLNRLIKEYERMDKSDWVEGEILFPNLRNLPKDFWNFDNSLFPMTNEYIQNIIIKYYPEIPKHKLNRLIREFDKIDKSEWSYGEIVFPTDDNLPKDFWIFSKS